MAVLGYGLVLAKKPKASLLIWIKWHFVTINFPAFTDGRGYSYARLLRERYDYKGEIRAIGDVMQDHGCSTCSVVASAVFASAKRARTSKQRWLVSKLLADLTRPLLTASVQTP